METPAQRVVCLFSRAVPTYDTVGPRHFEYFARHLVEFVGLQPGDSVLEVATGTGTVLIAAADRLRGTGHLVGVDLTPAMIERAAAAVCDRALKNIELKQGNAERLGLPPASFDVVLCAFELSSFTAKERALQEFRRVLRQGGRIGIVDTFGWYFEHDERWRRHAEVLQAFRAIDLSHDELESQEELVSLVGLAGFVHVDAIAENYELVFQDEDE